MDSEIRNELFTLLREVNDAGAMKDSQLRDCIDDLDEKMLTTRREPAADAMTSSSADVERAALVADLTVILQRVKYVKLGESLNPIAEEIIELVTAARDAEIREALLSKAAIEAGAKAVRALDWEVDEVGFFPTTEDVARVSLKAALAAITAPTGDHIGLHGDGTGGQG